MHCWLLFLAVTIASGCGGGNSNSPGNSANSSSTTVNIGDAPMAGIVAFVPAAVPGHQEEENGKLEDVKGLLASVSGSQFTIGFPNSTQTLTFSFDSNTVFDPTGIVLSSLPKGTILEVDAITQSGGLLAKKVEIETENQAGLETEGLVMQVTGNPTTSFQLVTHEVSAAGALVPNLGDTVTVNVSSNTNFRVGTDDVNLGALPFTPTF